MPLGWIAVRPRGVFISGIVPGIRRVTKYGLLGDSKGEHLTACALRLHWGSGPRHTNYIRGDHDH